MGENAITSLFNRAVLDFVAGGTLLILVLFGLSQPLDLNVASWAGWEFARFNAWILVLAIFVLGTATDRIASVVVDENLFRAEFQTRASNFQIPEWCRLQLESSMGGVALDVPPSKSKNLIDDSRVDWVSSMVITHARPEALAKRSDLIANYQFNSNMMLVSAAALVLLPTGLLTRGDVLPGLASFPVLLGIVWFLRTAGLRSLRRIHTFENQIVYGLFLPKPASP